MNPLRQDRRGAPAARATSRPVPLAPCLLLAAACALGCSDGSRGGSGADGGAGRDDAAMDGSAGADASDDGASRRDVPMAACETLSREAQPLPATLLFQVDTSNSMNCDVADRSCLTAEPTADPDDSRWDVFRRILLEALPTLPETTRVGLMRFPDAGAACAASDAVVEIGPLSSTSGPVTTALEGITPDGVSTPTHDAVLFGMDRLLSDGADDAYLVLATDGDARVCEGCDTACSFDALDADSEEMVDDIAAAAADDGIPTFVIGVPGSQGFREILSRMASAAGTDRDPACSDAGPMFCHYDLTDPELDFAAALRGALADIGEAVLSCEYDIPPNPDGTFDPMKVNVRLTEDDGSERTIPRDPSRTDGWDYSDDGERILLHGEACEAAQAATMGRIDIVFGCPTVLI